MCAIIAAAMMCAIIACKCNWLSPVSLPEPTRIQIQDPNSGLKCLEGTSLPGHKAGLVPIGTRKFQQALDRRLFGVHWLFPSESTPSLPLRIALSPPTGHNIPRLGKQGPSTAQHRSANEDPTDRIIDQWSPTTAASQEQDSGPGISVQRHQMCQWPPS
jgi:hypothetical protein